MASPPLPESPVAVFRADASAAIGGGHVMRCLVLADHLAARGWRCIFATGAESVGTVPALAASGHMIVAPDGVPAAADILIVDHYDLDARFETASRAWARRVVVLDDLADRPHDADLLIDASLGRRPADYLRLVPAPCRLLVGPDFALLRPEFPKARAASLARDRSVIRRVFVNFGATDPDNLTGRLLHGFAGVLPGVEFDVVLGAGAPHLAAVSAAAAHLPNIHLHVGPRDIARLISGADLAIGNAGTGAWERCALGVPSVVVAIADNQRAIAHALAQADAACVVERDSVLQVLASLSTERRLAMAGAAAGICDGLGALRVAGVIDPVLARDGKPVYLLPATADDCQRILDWQSAPGVRRFARNPDPPKPDVHRRWFAARRASADCVFNVIYYDGQPAGMLRFDRDEPGRDAFEVSILVAPDFQGRNIAAAALAMGRRLMPWAEFRAEVLPGNAVSAALFARMGYARSLHGRYVARPHGDAA